MSYSDFVKSKCKSGEDILRQLSEEDAHMIHMALGLAGEVGELIDCIKKTAIYSRPFDIANAKEELGDILFYFQGICNTLGYTIEELQLDNMQKLNKRYPEGYTDIAAMVRADKLEENAI